MYEIVGDEIYLVFFLFKSGLRSCELGEILEVFNFESDKEFDRV